VPHELSRVISTENKPIADDNGFGRPLTGNSILLYDGPIVLQAFETIDPDAVLILYGSVEDVLNVNCENAIFTKNEKSVESMYLEKDNLMRLK
jgi:hypothetical protein